MRGRVLAWARRWAPARRSVRAAGRRRGWAWARRLLAAAGVGWVVRASQNLPSRRSGLTCPPRATTASPAAVLLARPLAIGTNQGIHTCSSLNVLPTRAFPGGTPRTFSCEGAPRIIAQAFSLQRFPPVGEIG